jgi:transglutaminase-like putative cysteine protease
VASRRRHRLVVAFAAGATLVAGTALVAWLVFWKRAEPVYDVPRTVRYSITVHNPSNQLVRGARFWVFAPVALTAFQRVSGIEATTPFTLDTDSFGNQRLLFAADLAPYATKIVGIDVHLDLARAANAIHTDDSQRFVSAEEKIESNASAVAALGRNLQRDDAGETADAIFRWVSTNLEYAGYIEDDRGALYALEQRRGDCTEYSYLYTALARSLGIAARPIAGFVTSDNAVLRARDLHNWAEIYLDGRWRIVDPQNKRNREHEHEFIAMRLLGAAPEGLTNTHQLIGADSGLEIRMD